MIQEICGIFIGFIKKSEEYDVSFAMFEKLVQIGKAKSIEALRELEVLAVVEEHSFDHSLL